MNNRALLLTLALLGTVAVAQEKPSAEFVQESLEYCMEQYGEDSVSDSELLGCVNEEMELEGYAPFPSLKAVRSYVKKAKD
ncbi:MAG: hypothetical protein ACFHVJ_08060 [Aestuariibacter sp.]